MSDLLDETIGLANALADEGMRGRVEDLAGGYWGIVLDLPSLVGVDILVTIDPDAPVSCDVVVGAYERVDGSVASGEPIDWADSIPRHALAVIRATSELVRSLDRLAR